MSEFPFWPVQCSEAYLTADKVYFRSGSTFGVHRFSEKKKNGEIIWISIITYDVKAFSFPGDNGRYGCIHERDGSLVGILGPRVRIEGVSGDMGPAWSSPKGVMSIKGGA